VSILSFAFFSRKPDGLERGGEDEPTKGLESASATVRLRRLLQADAFNSHADPEPPEEPISPAADECVGPPEATDGSGSSESHAPSVATTIPVPASESSSEHPVERHRQDSSVFLAPVDDGSGAESEARRLSEMEISRVREQAARVQDASEKRLARMEHELAGATDRAHTAVALKRAAELEIARIREETGRKLAHLEQQLAAAAYKAQAEAARRRATELEIERVRQETARSSRLRGDQQAVAERAAAIAFDLAVAALQRHGDDASTPEIPLKRPTVRSAKSKKTTTSKARAKTVVKKPRTRTAAGKPSKAASTKTAHTVSKRSSASTGKKSAVSARKKTSASEARAKTVVKKSRTATASSKSSKAVSTASTKTARAVSKRSSAKAGQEPVVAARRRASKRA